MDRGARSRVRIPAVIAILLFFTTQIPMTQQCQGNTQVNQDNSGYPDLSKARVQVKLGQLAAKPSQFRSTVQKSRLARLAGQQVKSGHFDFKAFPNYAIATRHRLVQLSIALYSIPVPSPDLSRLRDIDLRWLRAPKQRLHESVIGSSVRLTYDLKVVFGSLKLGQHRSSPAQVKSSQVNGPR